MRRSALSGRSRASLLNIDGSSVRRRECTDVRAIWMRLASRVRIRFEGTKRIRGMEVKGKFFTAPCPSPFPALLPRTADASTSGSGVRRCIARPGRRKSRLQVPRRLDGTCHPTGEIRSDLEIKLLRQASNIICSSLRTFVVSGGYRATENGLAVRRIDEQRPGLLPTVAPLEYVWT